MGIHLGSGIQPSKALLPIIDLGGDLHLVALLGYMVGFIPYRTGLYRDTH